MKKEVRLHYIIFAAITMVAVITLLSFWLICNQKFFSLITERVVDDYAETTKAVQKNVEALLSYTEDFSKLFSQDEQVRELMREQNLPEAERTRNMVQIRSEWENISLRMIYSTSRLAGFCAYTEEKPLYSYFNSATTFDINIIPEEYMEEANHHKGPVWTRLLTVESAGSWHRKEEHVFSVLKYVQASQGEHLGTLALFIRESSFSDVLANAEDTRNRQFYLVDKNTMILSAEDKDCLYQKATEVLNLTWEQYQTCLEQGKLLLEPENGAPILYMSSVIDGTQTHLVGRTVLEELQIQRKELSLFMQIILLLSLAAAIAASWFVSKLVTKPINQIINVMKQIENSPNKEKLRCPVGGTVETSLLGSEFNRLMDKVDEAAEQIYQEQRQRRHNEIRLLQAQIVPHFLYNTLGMISALIKLNRQEQAQQAIQNLATFYRLSLSGGNEWITVREEMELTRNYLALQRMRYIEYVDYDMILDEKVSESLIPKLMIQPLVENVLNHGLRPDGQKCTIRIETSYDEANRTCVIRVSDNGLGMSKERLEQLRESLKNETSLTKSFGVLNVYQRMKLAYGDRFTMLIDSEEGAFTTFTLNIREEPDRA